MKNFMLGVLAMLVLFAGGYAVWSMTSSSEEVEPEAGDVIAANGSGGGSVRTSRLGNRQSGGDAEVAEEEAQAEEPLEDEMPSASEESEAPSDAPVSRPTAIARPTAPATVRPVTARRTCNSGPYIVFFDWDSSDITFEAAQVLDQVARAYENCGDARVRVAGHTDRANSDNYAVGLSQSMADSVVGYLRRNGIPGSRISSEAFGESRPRIPTADGVRELQNRRVEITFE